MTCLLEVFIVSVTSVGVTVSFCVFWLASIKAMSCKGGGVAVMVTAIVAPSFNVV